MNLPKPFLDQALRERSCARCIAIIIKNENYCEKMVSIKSCNYLELFEGLVWGSGF